MIYEYSRAGQIVEAEYPIGKAPKWIVRGGMRFARHYTMPVVRNLNSFERGEKPSISHQLPKWYGFGQREQCWKERMQQLGVEDTPHRRRQVLHANLGPSPKYVEKRSREAAAKAGALEHFDKSGKPKAVTKHKGVGYHIETSKRIEETPLKWD